MYKVLLVDDEPIILSGIKYLLDWGELDCEIAGTARNGKQAMDQIERIHPHIVICDIQIPVMSGVEVLKNTCQKYPEIVFIMLTNYQEFDLARESLRFKAVEYLVKAQMEEAVMKKALQSAIKESKRRQKISKVHFVEQYISTKKNTLIRENVVKLISAKDAEESREYSSFLEENNVLRSYSMLEIMMDFSHIPNFQNFNSSDRKRVFEFEKDVIEKLVCNFFPNYTIIEEGYNKRRLSAFLWDIPSGDFIPTVNKLVEKIKTASNNLTQAKLALLITVPFSGKEHIKECYHQMKCLQNLYYWNEHSPLIGNYNESVDFKPIKMESYVSRLTAEIHSKNISLCAAEFDKIFSKFISQPHQRENGITFLVDLYSVVVTVLKSIVHQDCEDESLPFEQPGTIKRLHGLLTLSETSQWLENLKSDILVQLEELSSVKSDIIEKALAYISDNIDQRIHLQEVAEHINISPNYLSALFRKQINQTFVEYINSEKMERACKLIRDQKYRIGEISQMLGFENAYYFTRVFKRQTGLTPTEYLSQFRK